MRALFIAIALAAMCSCVKVPYFRLDKPFYFEADQSFWSGCNKNYPHYEDCREYRIKQIYAGINEWFKYFDKADRPQVVVILSEKQLPAHLVNSVIHLKISGDLCEKWMAACYQGHKFIWSSVIKISVVFKTAAEIIRDSIAHEFGHALGRKDNDVPEGVDSVMSYTHPTSVTYLDFKMMCKLHYECRMMKRKHKKR